MSVGAIRVLTQMRSPSLQELYVLQVMPLVPIGHKHHSDGASEVAQCGRALVTEAEDLSKSPVPQGKRGK